MRAPGQPAPTFAETEAAGYALLCQLAERKGLGPYQAALRDALPQLRAFVLASAGGEAVTIEPSADDKPAAPAAGKRR